jgi:SAM-dependent methyltransferase
MSWDPAWEQLFRARGWNKYPSEQVIRFVARNFFRAPDRKQVRILELGCAEGNNIWFLAREGFDAYGIDGSQVAIQKAEQRMRSGNLHAHLLQGDVAFLKDLYADLRFDAILDAGCLTCNPVSVVTQVLAQARALLKPGGKIYSLLIANGTFGPEFGTEVEPGTYKDITHGALQGIGLCHVFTLEEVASIFSEFSGVETEYVMTSQDNQTHWYKHWVVEGTR